MSASRCFHEQLGLIAEHDHSAWSIERYKQFITDAMIAALLPS